MATVDEATRQQILQATVQIAMYEHADAHGVESGGRGLGTLVRVDGQTLIATHDHWTHFNANLNEVEFRTAQGDLLLTLNAAAFASLIRYRDGGTMLLSAPPELGLLTPTAISSLAPSSGDTVWFVRRSPADTGATVEVLAAQVEEQVMGSGPARLRLHASNGAIIVPGDSGGGVWINGQLLANLWSGTLQIRRTWFDRLLGRAQVTPTSIVTAATFPDVQGTATAP
jgi:hypothetical protein